MDALRLRPGGVLLSARSPSSAMPKSPKPATTKAPLPSPTVMKLQILGAVFVPMALVGVWLHRQGFW